MSIEHGLLSHCAIEASLTLFLNAHVDLSPCNRHHLVLAKRVRAGIIAAGGTPMEFPCHPIQVGLDCYYDDGGSGTACMKMQAYILDVSRRPASDQQHPSTAIWPIFL